MNGLSLSPDMLSQVLSDAEAKQNLAYIGGASLQSSLNFHALKSLTSSIIVAFVTWITYDALIRFDEEVSVS